MIPTKTIEDLTTLQQAHTPFTLIDVREQDEWDAGQIPGAIHLPLALVPLKLQELVPNKDTLIIMHCRSGGRSASATSIAQNLGYTNVYNLEGGYLAYTAQ